MSRKDRWRRSVVSLPSSLVTIGVVLVVLGWFNGESFWTPLWTTAIVVAGGLILFYGIRTIVRRMRGNNPKSGAEMERNDDA